MLYHIKEDKRSQEKEGKILTKKLLDISSCITIIFIHLLQNYGIGAYYSIIREFHNNIKSVFEC
jgi:hypothetical protein